MKVSFAVACLLGYTSAADPVWTLESVQNHRVDAGQMAAYGEHSTNQANGRPPYKSTVQLDSESESSDSESDDETNAQIAADNKYERIITPNFSSDSDDIFMRSMIKKY